MKLTSILTLAILTTLYSAQGEANDIKPVVATKTPSHRDLAKTQREQEIERHGEEREPIKPLVNITKRDLFAISTLFVHNGHWSMVPLNAVIHVPPELKGKVIASKPQGKLLPWPVFIKKYGGLFHTHELSMEQANAEKKIDPKAIKAFKGTGKIVVATYRRMPIAVHVNALKPSLKPAKKVTTPRKVNPK